ncbi:MAG: hypothetical protein NVSMB2_10420 [Chloroflexota bacterium]
MLPLAVITVVFGQLPTLISAVAGGNSGTQVAAASAAPLKRPVAADSGPPPTLVPPPPTPKPAATAVVAEPAPKPTDVPLPNAPYTVRPGDELKSIAAQSGVSIWKIIQANDIPNPDSLRVGQVLKIPEP